jgi:hypothetical protein
MKNVSVILLAVAAVAAMVGMSLVAKRFQGKPDAKPKETAVNRDAPQEQIPDRKPRAKPPADLPADLAWEVVSRQPKERGVYLEVRLSRRISETDLKRLTARLEEEEPKLRQAGYLLPDMPNGDGYWARVFYDPGLTVEITGATAEQLAAAKKGKAEPGREIVGRWLDETVPTLANVTVIYKKGGELYRERAYKGGGKRSQLMVEKSSAEGRKFMAAGEEDDGEDYWLVNADGDLEVWSKDRKYELVGTAKRVK